MKVSWSQSQTLLLKVFVWPEQVVSIVFDITEDLISMETSEPNYLDLKWRASSYQIWFCIGIFGLRMAEQRFGARTINQSAEMRDEFWEMDVERPVP